jgi:hypothetical protein
LSQKKRDKKKMINFLPGDKNLGEKGEEDDEDGDNASSGKAFMLPNN